MVYKRFRYSIIWRLSLIALVTWLGTFVWYLSSIYVAFGIIACIWLLLVAEFYRHILSAEKTIERFFNSFQIEGESVSFNHSYYKYFPEIKSRIPNIISAYNEIAACREKDYNLFNQSMIQAGIGIMTFDANGKIHFCNKAALALLEKDYFANISALNNSNPGFSDILKNLIANKPIIFKYTAFNKTIPLEIKSIDFHFENKRLKLLTLFNVSSTVEQGEIQAMQRLLRYMQHEIMNSLSPISLISGKLKEDCLQILESGNDDCKQSIQKISIGLQTINTRSLRLTEFFDGYRKLADLPAPVKSKFYIKDIFEHVQEVLKNNLSENNIKLVIQTVPDNLDLFADAGQIQLVIINLVKNAIESLDNVKNPKIKLVALTENGSVTIKTLDNGPGIPEEIKESVFMPYFTTKEHGSGIGLAFVKQILRNHDATIDFDTVADERTEFIIHF